MTESVAQAHDEHAPTIYPRERHSISRKNIDPDALRIMLRLVQHGFKGYLVGGGVRDLLLGKKPKDFDIATDASPSRIKALFRNSRIIGRRFKLAHIFFRGGKIIEVATFRDLTAPNEVNSSQEDENGEEPGQDGLKMRNRAPDDNKYGTEVTDALRRDLTINGLFYDISSFSIIDYVGGVNDLRSRLVRVIGDPVDRFEEDPVRMIRVVRHAAKTGFRIEEGALSAILDLHGLIESCPPMRVYEEVKKDLISGKFLGIARLLASARLLQHILPELLIENGALLADGTLFSAALNQLDSLSSGDYEVSPTVVLALIAVFSSSPMGAEVVTAKDLHKSFESARMLKELTQKSFSKLAVPRREREAIANILRHWWELEVSGPKRSKRVTSKLVRPRLAKRNLTVGKTVPWRALTNEDRRRQLELDLGAFLDALG